MSNLALALLLASVVTADTAVTAARHVGWPFELAVAVVTSALALLRRPGQPGQPWLLGQRRAAAAGLAVCAAAGVVGDVTRLPSQPGFAASAGLLVLGAAAVRVASARTAVAVGLCGAAVLVAGRVGLRGEYAVAFSFLGLSAWACALAVGVWLRLLDTRRGLAIDAARRDERLELARELHDIVAHHVAGIVVQAQAARIVAARRPQDLGEPLAGIELAGNDALAAMRRVVGLLRDPGDAAGVSPGPAQLTDLVRRFAVHGPAVRLRLPDQGGPPWPPEVSATVYRVVREALTNVVLHARDAATVTVTVADDRGGLAVEVADDAPARSPAARLAVGAHGLAGLGAGHGGAGGHGLIGMRERLEALGGTLRVGPGPEGGWVVAATLPLAAGGRFAGGRV